MEATYDKKVRRIRFDQAAEFLSKSVMEYLDRAAIEIEPSAAYAHEQNGKAERGNRIDGRPVKIFHHRF